MVLRITPRWFYLLVAFLGLLVLGLGTWWLYLLSTFSRMLGDEHARMANMLRWEGTTFLALFCAAAFGLSFLYWRDLKKTRALQALFASLTHELKTPLASMRLQAEVIRDLIADESHDHAQLTALTTRLIQDTSKFEHELDKGLQLSRVEQDGTLSLSAIELGRFIKKLASKQGLPVEVIGDEVVMADEMALNMVFRNLLENTARHNPKSAGIKITLKNASGLVQCHYDDQGPVFNGNRKQLGELFYKHDSKRGTGIGLYLIKQLMRSQQGRMQVSESGPLTFTLFFKRGVEA